MLAACYFGLRCNPTTPRGLSSKAAKPPTCRSPGHLSRERDETSYGGRAVRVAAAIPDCASLHPIYEFSAGEPLVQLDWTAASERSAMSRTSVESVAVLATRSSTANAFSRRDDSSARQLLKAESSLAAT
jgi:hypothetical protein